MRKTHNGEKVYALSDVEVMVIVNNIDGYIERLREVKEKKDVDCGFILRKIKERVINPKAT